MKLVTASRDLELGTIIRENDLVLTDWPGEPPPGSSAHTQDVIGRGVITKIYAKEPILESRLAPKGSERWIRSHDRSGYARHGGAGQSSGRGRRIRSFRDARRCDHLGNSARRTASTELSAHPKFSFRISLPASGTAARGASHE